MPRPSWIVRVPTRFIDDHAERDLDTPSIYSRTTRHYYISRNDRAYSELVEDAQYYADDDVGWVPEVAPIRNAARALLRALGEPLKNN